MKPVMVVRCPRGLAGACQLTLSLFGIWRLGQTSQGLSISFLQLFHFHTSSAIPFIYLHRLRVNVRQLSDKHGQFLRHRASVGFDETGSVESEIREDCTEVSY